MSNAHGIDLVKYGELTQQVRHLADAQEEQNELLRGNIQATNALVQSVNTLSSRLQKIEGSPFMQPAKLGRALAIVVAVTILFAINGVKETIESFAKGILP